MKWPRLLVLGGLALPFAAVATPGVPLLGGSGAAEPGVEAAPAVPPEEQDLPASTAALETAIERQTHLNVARARTYVKQARAGLLPLSGGFEALVEHTSSVQRLRVSLERGVHALDRLRTQLAQAQADAERAARTRRTEGDNAELTRRAVAAAQDREEAFLQAFDGDWSPGRRAVYAADNPPTTAGGFDKQRGHLPFPVAGRADVSMQPSPVGGGSLLVFKTRAQSTVRSVFPGRVSFAADYPGLGPTVILDHGGEYYTVSAGLSAVSVEVGEEVGLGAPLGTVGFELGQGRLLFELRHKGHGIEPARWFGL
jgi:murein hydrolase activator